MTIADALPSLVVLAGAGQLVLCLASPFIPVVLKWPEQLRALPKLLRQVFWTYAGYILGSHLIFAVISLCAARWLLDGTVGAGILSGYIALWWTVRLVLHLTGLDTSEVPNEGWQRFAKYALGLLFVALSVVYLGAFLWNLGILT